MLQTTTLYEKTGQLFKGLPRTPQASLCAPQIILRTFPVVQQKGGGGEVTPPPPPTPTNGHLYISRMLKSSDLPKGQKLLIEVHKLLNYG